MLALLLKVMPIVNLQHSLDFHAAKMSGHLKEILCRHQIQAYQTLDFLYQGRKILDSQIVK